MTSIKVGGEVTKREVLYGMNSSFLTEATGQLAGNYWKKPVTERKNYEFNFGV